MVFIIQKMHLTTSLIFFSQYILYLGHHPVVHNDCVYQKAHLSDDCASFSWALIFSSSEMRSDFSSTELLSFPSSSCTI